MISLKNSLFALIGVNFLTLVLIAVMQQGDDNSSNPFTQSKTNLLTAKTSYSFDDPVLAYNLLEQLDIFEIVDAKDVPGSNYNTKSGCFKTNYNYCNEHRAYFVQHPELVFEQYRFESNFGRYHKLRSQVFTKLGKDMHIEHGPHSSYPVKSEMKPDINIFYTENYAYMWKQIGKQFSCLSQASNHVPGHDKMYRKDLVSQNIVDYGKKYKSRPQCFNHDKYFLKNWVMTDKTQCLDFFEEFNGPRYEALKEERNVVYFRKIGAYVHQGQGVFPVTDDEEKNIREMYKNGELCGEVSQNNIIQYNVWNSLLVKKRKPGMRVFLLVASTNPLIAYYHDGYVRLSLNEYDVNAQDKGTFVTNIHVNVKEAHDGTNPFAGMSHQEIDDYTCWMNSQFHEYLMEQGIVKDPKWLDNYFRTELKKIMIHLLRMSSDGFIKRSSVFELWGLDFVMDDKLNLWFIEANANPLVDGFTRDSTKLMNQMLLDVFDIVAALLRSRMKRVVNYINMLTRELGTDKIPDLEQRRQEFKELTRNYYEPDFEPRPDNTFQKIVDENESGTARYANLMKKECL